MREKLLTPEQVAEMLQVHHLTVLKYLKAGKIRSIKLGRVYRIREKDLDAFFDSQYT